MIVLCLTRQRNASYAHEIARMQNYRNRGRTEGGSCHSTTIDIFRSPMPYHEGKIILREWDQHDQVKCTRLYAPGTTVRE